MSFEQHLDYLAESLSKLFTEYNRGLLVTDRRTGGQGAIQIQNETVLRTFRSCVLEIMMQCQNGKPIVGLHDNSILKHLRDFQELFPRPSLSAYLGIQSFKPDRLGTTT